MVTAVARKKSAAKKSTSKSAAKKKPAKKKTSPTPAEAVNSKSLQLAYDVGVQARKDREPIDAAPGKVEEPLNMEWRRGWMAHRSGECQTNNLLSALQETGLDAAVEELEGLDEGQRIKILDWLDSAPAEGDPHLWRAFDLRIPEFAQLTGGLTEPSEVHDGLRIVKFVAVVQSDQLPPESSPPENAAGGGENAPGGAPAANSTESSPPTAATASAPASDDLQMKFTRQSQHLQAIETASAKFEELDELVTEREADVKTAKGRLSEAQGERDKAGRELREVIGDSKNGQGKLFSQDEISAARTAAPISTPAIDTAVGKVPVPRPAIDKIAPLTVLSAKEIKKLVGVDEFNAKKDSIEGPIGLSDKQIELLESACESDTLQGLEKWIAADSLWMNKIKGMGPKGIDKVTSTIMAYRRVHPVPQA